MVAFNFYYTAEESWWTKLGFGLVYFEVILYEVCDRNGHYEYDNYLIVIDRK